MNLLQRFARAVRPHLARGVRFVAIGIVLLFTATTVSADIGPKPEMYFLFEYQTVNVPILGGQQIECEDAACVRGSPLQRAGPQDFGCNSTGCGSRAYGYSSYHKLVIQFSDRTRESNVFEGRGFGGKFIVTVKPEELSIRQTFNPFILFDPLGTVFAFGVALIATLCIELFIGALYVGLRRLPGRIIPWIILANLLTVPVVWFLFPLLPLEWLALTILSETFAVISEALLLYWTNKTRLLLKEAAILSLLMNLGSFLAGLVISI